MSRHSLMLAINRSQKERVVTFGARTYARIPYGQERDATGAPRAVPSKPCRHCGVNPHQLHIFPCVGEQCPCCRDEERVTCEEHGCTADIRRAHASCDVRTSA